MQINTEKLLTISHFAEIKKISRQHIYRLVQNEELTLVEIDKIKFVLLDEKAENLIRKRREKTKRNE